MKKILALILASILILSFASCSKKIDETAQSDSTQTESDGAILSDSETEEIDSDAKEDNKADTNKTQDKDNQDKPADKGNNNNGGTVENKPETKPETKPEPKPETKPETKPEAKPEPEAPKTVGTTLLAAFKAKASSGNALSVAEALVTHEIIAFSGGAMEVEPGYLTGFDNTEIKGFKEGAVFMPMIGTIPFVGYVFTLEDGQDASAFIANLKSAANPRWNICTTADETVAGYAGNKVFFVMCPTSFEE